MCIGVTHALVSNLNKTLMTKLALDDCFFSLLVRYQGQTHICSHLSEKSHTESLAHEQGPREPKINRGGVVACFIIHHKEHQLPLQQGGIPFPTTWSKITISGLS